MFSVMACQTWLEKSAGSVRRALRLPAAHARQTPEDRQHLLPGKVRFGRRQKMTRIDGVNLCFTPFCSIEPHRQLQIAQMQSRAAQHRKIISRTVLSGSCCRATGKLRSFCVTVRRPRQPLEDHELHKVIAIFQRFTRASRKVMIAAIPGPPSDSYFIAEGRPKSLTQILLRQTQQHPVPRPAPVEAVTTAGRGSAGW